MAKRPQPPSLKPSTSKAKFPPHARRRFNFDVFDEDFKEFTEEYLPIDDFSNIVLNLFLVTNSSFRVIHCSLHNVIDIN